MKTNHQSTWDCEIDPNKIVEGGTTLVLPYVWAYTEHGHTPHKDIQVTIEKDTSLSEALFLLEEEALEFVKSHGAERIRHYFIEGVIFDSGFVVFLAGT